jgi:lia operon protein LiaG
MKKIAGVLLVILGIIMFAHSIWWSPFNFFVPHAKEQEEKISVHAVDVIELDITSEDLTIVPTDEEKLKVIATGRDLNHVKFDVDRDHGTVKIDLKPKWYSFSNTNELKLLVYVPRNKVFHITAKAVSRVVQVGDHKSPKWSIGNLNMDVSAGTSNLRNLKVGNLLYNGTSADVFVDRVNAGQATMDTFSGNMNISHYTGALNLASTSGNIRIQVDKLIGNIHTEILSGSATMYLPKDSSFTLRSGLQSGQMTATYPIKLQKLSPTETIGKSGSGKYKIETEIASGELSIH